MVLPQPGSDFGAYEIRERLGRGGMGVVYSAVHRGLDREVAIKLLSPELAESEEYRTRFLREAKVLARLESPYIVRVHDAGEHDGWLYIATELIDGGDLKTYVTDHGVPAPALGIQLVLETAIGLHAAHTKGVLHRDIKPSNVLLRRVDEGRLEAVLCDLGISAVLGEDHTKTVGVIGTLGYMSPEQHQGEASSVASDIYGLGCLLWSSLTGEAPYVGTDLQVALGHVSGEIPQLDEAMPWAQEINAILRVAMAKDPAERHESARQFAESLAAVADVPASGQASPSAWRSMVEAPTTYGRSRLEGTIRKDSLISTEDPSADIHSDDSAALEPTTLKPSVGPTPQLGQDIVTDGAAPSVDTQETIRKSALTPPGPAEAEVEEASAPASTAQKGSPTRRRVKTAWAAVIALALGGTAVAVGVAQSRGQSTDQAKLAAATIAANVDVPAWASSQARSCAAQRLVSAAGVGSLADGTVLERDDLGAYLGQWSAESAVLLFEGLLACQSDWQQQLDDAWSLPAECTGPHESEVALILAHQHIKVSGDSNDRLQDARTALDTCYAPDLGKAKPKVRASAGINEVVFRTTSPSSRWWIQQVNNGGGWKAIEGTTWAAPTPRGSVRRCQDVRYALVAPWDNDAARGAGLVSVSSHACAKSSPPRVWWSKDGKCSDSPGCTIWTAWATGLPRSSKHVATYSYAGGSCRLSACSAPMDQYSHSGAFRGWRWGPFLAGSRYEITITVDGLTASIPFSDSNPPTTAAAEKRFG